MPVNPETLTRRRRRRPNKKRRPPLAGRPVGNATTGPSGVAPEDSRGYGGHRGDRHHDTGTGQTVNATLGGAGVAAAERARRRFDRALERAASRTATEVSQTTPTTQAAATAQALAIQSLNQGRYSRAQSILPLMDAEGLLGRPVTSQITLDQLADDLRLKARHEKRLYRESIRQQAEEIGLPTVYPTGAPIPLEFLEEQLQSHRQTVKQARAEMARAGREAFENQSYLQQLVSSGVVGAGVPGLFEGSQKASNVGRRAVFGSRNPGVLELALTAPLPAVGGARLALRGAQTATRALRAADRAEAGAVAARAAQRATQPIRRTINATQAAREAYRARAAARLAQRQEALARAGAGAAAAQEAARVARGAGQVARGTARAATLPVRHPVQAGKGLLAAQPALAVAAQNAPTPGPLEGALNIATTPAQLAQTAFENPAEFTAQTVRGTRDILFGLVPALAETGRALFEAAPGTSGGTERLEALVDAVVQDVEQRYGPLAEGDKEEFRRRVLEGYTIEMTDPETGETVEVPVPGGGAAPFLLDAAIAAPPAGRAIGALARRGALGSRVEEAVTRARPAQRISGDVVRVREPSGNVFTLPVQRAADWFREGVTKRRASRGNLLAQEAAKKGQITPLLRGHQGARFVAGTKARALLGMRHLGAEEIGAGLLREASRDLGRAERRGVHTAVVLGVRTPEQARELLPRRIEQIRQARHEEATRLAERSFGDEWEELSPDDRAAAINRIEKEIVPSRWDNIPDLERQIEKADEIFTPALAEFADRQVVRGQQGAELDPRFTEETAERRRRKPLAELVGVAEFKPADAAQFERAFKRAKAEGRGAYLSPHTREDFQKFEGLFLSDDGKVGVGLQRADDGVLEAVSLFNDAGPKGAGLDLLRLAVANGATRLDAIGEGLRRKYEQAGFVVTETIKWNDKYAPKGWNYERDGRPNIYVMERRGEDGAGPADPLQDFFARVDKQRERMGLADPGYFPSRVRRDRPDFSVRAAGGSRAIRVPRKYQGKLYRLGIEDTRINVMAEGFLRNYKAATNWNLVADVFERTTIPGWRDKSLFDLLRQMEQRGVNEGDVVFVNMARFREIEPLEVLEREMDEAGLSLDPEHVGSEALEAALKEATMTPAEAERLALTIRGHSSDNADFPETQGWSLMPKAEYEELTSGIGQTAIGRIANIVLTQKPSRFILGWFNVPWLQFQVMSNAFMTGIVGGVGPHQWAQAAHWWSGLSPDVRRAVSPYLGDGSHFFPEESKLGAASTNRLVNAWRGLKETVGGKRIWGTGARVEARQLHPPNLFLGADRAQNNFFRRALFTNSLKREAIERINQNAGAMGRLQNRLMSMLSMRRAKDQMEAMLRDPAVIERHARAVDELLGDYTTFTKFERSFLKRYIMFYSFLRFSLRLAFYTMPVKHPVMSGILGHLARMETAEIRDMLGGDLLPYALGRWYPEGPDMVVDLQRANPVLNALSQTVFGYGAQGKLAGLSGLLSPWFGAISTQIAGIESFTGRPVRIAGESTSRIGTALGLPLDARLRIFGRQTASMFFPYRALEEMQRDGRPVTSDHLVFSPRFIEYSDPEVRRDIKQTSNQLGADVGTELLRQAFPYLPQPSTDAEIMRDLRERVIEDARTLGSDSAISSAAAALGITKDQAQRLVRRGSSDSSDSEDFFAPRAGASDASWFFGDDKRTGKGSWFFGGD